MTLPSISIPEIPIPFEIPELIHPAIVHFAIAIPVVILLLELYNLIARRKSISLFSLFLLIIVAVAMIGAYLTGSVDGKATWDMLSSEGQADLKAHKLLGIYLVYGSLALVVLKLLFMAIRKTVAKLLFILILGGFISATLYQGKEGGELVYEFGANNEMVKNIKSDGEDIVEEQEELKEKFDELQKKYDALVEKSKDAEASSTSVEITIPATEAAEENVSKETSSTETNTTN